MPFIPLNDVGGDVEGATIPASDDTRRGFIPLNDTGSDADSSGFVALAPTEEVKDPNKTSVLRNILVNNSLTAAAETAMNLGSMAVSMPAAGLAGLATEAGRLVGLTNRTGADVVHSVGGALTYQPRGEMGQAATAMVSYPFEKLAEAGQYAGGKTLDATGSPALATAVDSAIQLAPMLIDPAVRAARRTKSAPVAESMDPAAVESGAAAEAGQGFIPLESAKPTVDVLKSQLPENTQNPPQAFTKQGPAATNSEAVNAPKNGAVDGRTHSLAPEPTDIAPHLAAGAEELTSFKQAGGSVHDAMVSPGAHADAYAPETQQLARFLADNYDNPQKLGEFDAAYRAALETPDSPTTTAERSASHALYPEDINRRQPGENPRATQNSERQSENAPGGQGGHQGDGAASTTAGLAERSEARQSSEVRYKIVEAEELRTSHDVNMRSRDSYPDQLKRGDWSRADAETRVQAIVKDLDPARLAESVDDGSGAPIMALDGTVEAGNARAIALQRVYQANGQKAADYKQYLRDNAERFGLDPSEVDTARKPVLVRVPDEPMQIPGTASQAGVTAPAVQDMAAGVRNSWAPGANYVPLVDQHRPAVSKASAVADLPTPIRREHIITQLASALGTTVYQGRVKGKKRLGFFRPGLQETRIKNYGDIEVAAHEIAHLIDDRVPAIANAWRSDKALREELRSISYDQANVPEGFAEGVRLWMTQPDALQAKAPKVHDWLENFANTHEYGKAMRTAQGQMTGWFGQDALNRARSKIGTETPLREYFDGFWDKFRQSVTDDLHGVYRMERELTGGKIIPNGPYESARLSRASASIADGAVRFGAPVKQADGSFKFVGKGLEEIMQPLSGALDDSLLYFVGRSSRELMGQGREHLFTPGEIDAMLKLRTPERAKAFEEYQAWNAAILDFAEAQGVINPESRRLWQRTQYLPFHRVSQPGGLKGKPGDWAGVQALTGGTTNLKDILGNMLGNSAQLVDRAVKNEARRKIANLSMKHGGGKFMVKIDAEARPVKISGDQVLDAMLKKYGIGIDGDAPAFFEFLIHGQPPAGNNVVAVLQRGKPIWFEVGDPILMRALQSIDRPIQNEVVRWLGLPKRVGQATITATPDFWMANLARDTIMGSVMSRTGFRPVLDSLQGMRTRLTNDPIYKDYLANGGGMSSYFLDERHVRTKLEKFYRDQRIDYRTVLDTPGKLLEFVETMGDAFEMSTRLGEFKRAVNAGENPRHAAYMGRDVSTDFAMRGDSKALGFMYDTVMFLRPALVSWDRLYRGLAHDPNKGAIAAKAGSIALMSAALYLYNKDDSRYQDLPDWERDAYWHFFVGDQHFRYPKVWEIGAMASAAERSVEKIIEENPQGLGKDFARIMGTTFNLNLMPQIIAPAYDQGANRNSFTKAPIETPGMDNMQPFMRAKPTTSETLKAAGMATADLPEALQVNPVRTEALLRGYFNTWAMYGLMLSDKAFFDDKSPALRTDQLPVVRRFYTEDPPQSTKYETQFYDLLGEARRLHGSMRELDKIGRSDIADRKEQEPMATESLPLERASKNLQSINQEMRKVRRDDTTPDEKRAALDKLIVERNDLLKRAVTDSVNSRQAQQQ